MKNDDKIVIAKGGMTFIDCLALTFIILKLTGVISWSWIWVLAPFWIPLVLVGILFLILLIMFLTAKYWG